MASIGLTRGNVICFRHCSGALMCMIRLSIPTIRPAVIIIPGMSILPLPTITVYAPSNADYIQEITVNYDAHSSFEQMYTIYEELCYYTLKVMFPDLLDNRIRELYTTLNRLAFEHDTNMKYTAESVPCALYYRDNIGMYPYFAWGEDVHLCIIPVTQARIEEMRNKGVEIIEF